MLVLHHLAHCLQAGCIEDHSLKVRILQKLIQRPALSLARGRAQGKLQNVILLHSLLKVPQFIVYLSKASVPSSVLVKQHLTGYAT